MRRQQWEHGLDPRTGDCVGSAAQWDAGSGLQRKRRRALARRTKGVLASSARINIGLVMNCFPQTRMSPVVIATPLTEGLPAAPRTAGRANSCSAVSTLSHSTIVTGHSHVAIAENVFDLARGIHTVATAFVRENQDEVNGQYLLPLSCHPLWSGCGVSFTARCNVGWSSASPSDRSGAATRNASTSCFSLDTSRSFCLRTS
jgi:hypothetical protein